MYLPPSLAVLALLPLALGLEEERRGGLGIPDFDPRHLPVHTARRQATGYRACAGGKHLSKRSAAPDLGVSGLSVDVHGRQVNGGNLERRAANGSIIALGSAHK